MIPRDELVSLRAIKRLASIVVARGLDDNDESRDYRAKLAMQLADHYNRFERP